MPLYPDVHYMGPPRAYGDATRKTGVAIHNTSNARRASAEDEGSYARTRTDGTSSHYYVDNDSIIQSLDTSLAANHAGNYEGNTRAIAYEITGQNGDSRQYWLDHVAWPLLARQIARDCRAHNIPARRLTIAEMRAGHSGIYTHDDMRQAWAGTDHTDPGPNFPMDHLLALVQRELSGQPQEDDMGAADDAFTRPYTGIEPWIGGQSWMSKAVETPLNRAIVMLGQVLRAQGVSQADIDELQARPAGFTAEQMAAKIREFAEQFAAETDVAVIERALTDVLSRTGLTVRQAE